MNLSFSKEINGKPTRFIEKIWAGIGTKQLEDRYIFHKVDAPEWDTFGEYKPKIHTIREDSFGRWKPGMNIHFIINPRTSNVFRFAPVVRCISVQEIEIYQHITPVIHAVAITVDGNALYSDDVDKLAINDGFDSTEEFLDYFKDGFKGKIIHWTDFKY